MIVSPKGGSVLQWQWREHFILGPARKVLVGGEMKERGETHWCYPNFGPIREPKYASTFPQHGLLRSTVLETLSHNGMHARFYAPSPAWGQGLSISTFVLTGLSASVQMGLSVTNNSKQRLPVLPALHPYFQTPKEGLRVVVGGVCVAEILKGLSRGISSPAWAIKRTGDIFVELCGIGVVELRPSQDCTHIVIWSDAPDEYVCVEPVFGTPMSYGTPGGRWLRPGRTINSWCAFDLSPF